MIFIDNKYTCIYFRIVNRARTRRLNGYQERHHVIPRSLGGSNESDNLVNLTAKEHYIVHLLLPMMVITAEHRQKMWRALFCMSKLQSLNHRRHTGSSRFYEKARNNTDFGIGNRGRTQPTDERQRRAQSLKGHATSAETRSKIGDANRGRKLPPPSTETREKLRIAGLGRKLSEETKRKISESSKKRGNNGFKGKGNRGLPKPESRAKFKETIAFRPADWKSAPREIVSCPVCGRTRAIGQMKRYHFDNCKSRSASLSVS